MRLEEFMRIVSSIAGDYANILKLINDLVKAVEYSGGFIKLRYRNCPILEPGAKTIIIGDLHGDYDTLIEIISREDALECLSKNKCVMVFLGDYIDRGFKQLETIITVYTLKSMFPGNVIVLRGNHEPPPELIPHPHDFPETLYMRFGKRWTNLYAAFLRSFQKLPYMSVIPGFALLLHGGPPSTVLKARTFIEAFGLDTPTYDDLVLEDIIWSDPVEANIEYMESYRGAGKLYGKPLTRRALMLSKTRFIIRSHEPPFKGYKIDHDSVVTIFTSRVYGLSRISYMVISRPTVIEKPEDIEAYINII